jgi:predicted protein tyrosine phosphatase
MQDNNPEDIENDVYVDDNDNKIITDDESKNDSNFYDDDYYYNEKKSYSNKNKNTLSSIFKTYPIYWIYGKVRAITQPYIDTSFDATQIIANLWVGSISSSSNSKTMKSHNIELIVSAHVGATPLFPYDFTYKKVDLLDIPNENIYKTFDKIVPEIHHVIERNKGVLIHCMVGASRSVSIACAYLMKYHNMGTIDALKYMKKLREEVNPNEGYIRQLKKYELHLKQK